MWEVENTKAMNEKDRVSKAIPMQVLGWRGGGGKHGGWEVLRQPIYKVVFLVR